MAKESGVKFFADQNIAPKLVTILRHLDERSITSIYKTDLVDKPDTEWVPAATQRGYVCVTCDCAMTSDLAIAQVLANENARAIFFGDHFSNSKKWEQALWLLRYWHRISEYAEGMAAGQLVRVNKNGRIVPVQPGKKRRVPPKRYATHPSRGVQGHSDQHVLAM